MKSDLVIIKGRFGDRPFRKIRTTKEKRERRRRRRKQEACATCGLRTSRSEKHSCFKALRGAFRNYTSSLEARIEKRKGKKAGEQ